MSAASSPTKLTLSQLARGEFLPGRKKNRVVPGPMPGPMPVPMPVPPAGGRLYVFVPCPAPPAEEENRKPTLKQLWKSGKVHFVVSGTLIAAGLLTVPFSGVGIAFIVVGAVYGGTVAVFKYNQLLAEMKMTMTRD